jgi:hypothetical protein
MKRNRRSAPWLSLTLLAMGVGSSCVPAAPVVPVGPPPLTPEQAAEIDRHLVACDLGSVIDCGELVDALTEAKRFEDAWAALDHGCAYRGGGKARAVGDGPYYDRCSPYAPGRPCDPGMCERCAAEGAASSPECASYDAEACGSGRATRCPYDQLETCLSLNAALVCGQGDAIASAERLARGSLDDYCGAHDVEVLQRALAYQQEGCRRYEAAGSIDALDDGRGLYCDDSDLQYSLQQCADYRAREIEYERQQQAMQAELLQTVTQSMQQVAAIGTGVAAAKAGLVPVYQPGAPAGAGIPIAYVNPASSKQWTSPGLAFIASRLPERPRAPQPPASSSSASQPPPPPTVASAPPPDATATEPPPPQPRDEPTYDPGSPSAQLILGYWNPRNGRVETARAETAAQVDAKTEYARTQCRFWSSDADRDACEALSPCGKRGFYALALGKTPSGKFRVGGVCGASTRKDAEAGALSACSEGASGCAILPVNAFELRD